MTEQQRAANTSCPSYRGAGIRLIESLVTVKMTEKQRAGTNTSCPSLRGVRLIESLVTVKMTENSVQGPTPVVRLTEVSVKRDLTVRV